MPDRAACSPRERGWTDSGKVGGWISGVFPARAGMDPHKRRCVMTFRCVPRASGDGPQRDYARGWKRVCSPRERGWTAVCHFVGERHAVFPARAGMDPPHRRTLPAPCRVPRASGDGPSLCHHGARAVVSSPRERGWTAHEAVVRAKPTVFPARAGIDPTKRPLPWWAPRVLRARGYGPNRTDKKNGAKTIRLGAVLLSRAGSVAKPHPPSRRGPPRTGATAAP